MANIRQLLSRASSGTGVDETNTFNNTYSEQSITLSDGTTTVGGGDVNISYVKGIGSGRGYFSVASTRYTQVEQPFIPKTGADDVTGDVVNSKAYGGGFKIEDRPLIGNEEDDSTTTSTNGTSTGGTSTGGSGSSY